MTWSTHTRDVDLSPRQSLTVALYRKRRVHWYADADPVAGTAVANADGSILTCFPFLSDKPFEGGRRNAFVTAIEDRDASPIGRSTQLQFASKERVPSGVC